MKSPLLAALICCVSFTIANAETPQISRWIGDAGAWSSVDNWDISPASGSYAIIDNGGNAHVADTLYDMTVVCGDTGSGSITFGGEWYWGLSQPGIHFILGNEAGAYGSCEITYYSPNSSPVVSETVIIGKYGEGIVSQDGVALADPYGPSGGTTHYVNSRLVLGQEEGSEGTYVLNGGTLLARNTETECYIGYNGTGRFIQSGGSFLLSSMLIGHGGSSYGHYDMRDGAIGRSPYGHDAIITVNNGVLSQSGGAISANVIITEQGRYELTGGSYYGRLQVEGLVVQNGGIVQGTTSIPLEMPEVDISGRYELNSGILNSGWNMRIVSTSGEMAELVQSGGEVDVRFRSGARWGILQIGDSDLVSTSGGKYTMSGGSLHANMIRVGEWYSSNPGWLEITDNSASVSISGTLWLLTSAFLNAVPGTTFRFDAPTGIYSQAHFRNYAAPENVADLINVTFAFEGGGSIQAMQITGRDLGASEEGYALNYAIGTIAIGVETASHLCLKVVADWGLVATEAQYVDTIVLGTDSILDLNGHILYYRNFIDNGGTLLLNGGQFIQVPEPASLSLLAVGALCLLRRRSSR